MFIEKQKKDCKNIVQSVGGGGDGLIFLSKNKALQSYGDSRLFFHS